MKFYDEINSIRAKIEEIIDTENQLGILIDNYHLMI